MIYLCHENDKQKTSNLRVKLFTKQKEYLNVEKHK
jgi:hypothetical protein